MHGGKRARTQVSRPQLDGAAAQADNQTRPVSHDPGAWQREWGRALSTRPEAAGTSASLGCINLYTSVDLNTETHTEGGEEKHYKVPEPWGSF